MTRGGLARAAREPQPVVAVDCNGADLGPGRGRRRCGARGRRRARACCCSGRPAELGEPPTGVEVVDAPISIAKADDPVAAARTDARGLDRAGSDAPSPRAARRRSCAPAGPARRSRPAPSTSSATRGIYRPALALPLPVPAHPVTLLDVGANAEARREHLVQFAFMGAALARTVLGVERPRVGLLSNGEEAARGSALVLETDAELRERAASGSTAFDFVGNVEGGDLVTGAADVVVTDGFTGNIALKLIEGISQTILRRDPRRGDVLDARASSGGLLLRGALGGLRDGDRPRSERRRLPARAAPAGRRAARPLHARGLRAGDPARAARRARGHRRTDPPRARARRARCKRSPAVRAGR